MSYSDNKLSILISENGFITVEGKVSLTVPATQNGNWTIQYDNEDSKNQIEELMRRNKMLNEQANNACNQNSDYLSMLFQALPFLEKHNDPVAQELVKKLNDIRESLSSFDGFY